MGSVKWLITFMAIFSFIALYAQQVNHSGKEGQKAPMKQSAQAAGKKQRVANPADSAVSSTEHNNEPGGVAAGNVSNGNPDGPGNTSSTSGLIQETSSSSGSPAILSGGKGTARDGTNNMQRASMNMAGSPATNLHLTRTKPVDVSEQMQKMPATDNRKAAAPPADRINKNTRRANNVLSDQNLSSKDKGTRRLKEKSGKRSGDKRKKG